MPTLQQHHQLSHKIINIKSCRCQQCDRQWIPMWLHFVECIPVAGSILALVYLCMRRHRDASRAAIWSCLGLIPLYNLYRLFVVVYRYSPCLRRKIKNFASPHDSNLAGRPLPTDCQKCVKNEALHQFNHSLPPSGQEGQCWRCGRLLISFQSKTENQEFKTPAKIDELGTNGSHYDMECHNYLGCSICFWWESPNLFHSWMSIPSIQSKSLLQVTIPGTHNSTATQLRYLIGSIPPWTCCQNDSVRRQLELGVRYFDIRLRDTRDLSTFKTERRLCAVGCCLKKPQHRSILWTAHSFLAVPFESVIEEIHQFFLREETQHEMVIISIRPDWPTQLSRLSGDEISRVLLRYFKYDEFVNRRSELTNTIAALRAQNRRIVLICQDCHIDITNAVPYIDYRQLLKGSWGTTNNVCATKLHRSLTNWIASNCPKSKDNNAIHFNVIQGELTPDTLSIINGFSYHSLTGEGFLDLEDAASSAARVLKRGLLEDWNEYFLGIVTQDYATVEVIAATISRNGQTEIFEHWLKHRQHRSLPPLFLNGKSHNEEHLDYTRKCQHNDTFIVLQKIECDGDDSAIQQNESRIIDNTTEHLPIVRKESKKKKRNKKNKKTPREAAIDDLMNNSGFC